MLRNCKNFFTKLTKVMRNLGFILELQRLAIKEWM